MNALDLERFNQLIGRTQIKPRLKRELRFVASTTGMNAGDWAETELQSIADRTGNAGVLLLAPGDELYVLPYEISKGLANRQTGRAQPIICDFCRTWQSGSNAASITFRRDKRSLNSVGFLCCADLACSRHVRNLTDASITSRAQLREDLTDKQRAERLRVRLAQLISDLKLEPCMWPS